MAERFYRDCTFDRAGINTQKRTIAVSFSSELPVDRGSYIEILDHDPANADFSFLNNSAPVLDGHDTTKQAGVVESAQLVGKRGEALLRFSKGTLGTEIFQDFQDGIRKNISFGYTTTKEINREKTADGRIAIRFAFRAHEISVVAIPADSTVGFGRASQQKITVMTSPQNQNSNATEIEFMATKLGDRIPGLRERADRAILAGETFEAFRSREMELMPQSQPIIGRPTASSDFKSADLKRYSIARALNTLASGRALDGLEGELSREIEKRSGTAAQGFYLPDEVMVSQQRNAVAGTGTLGGMLVMNENLGDQFVELLRNRACVVNLGARILNLEHPVTIPRQSAAGTVNWLNGETVASTLSGVQLQQLTLTPSVVGAFQQYSKQLLITSNPSTDMVIRNDILQQIALCIDLAAIHGSGSGGQPTGIFNTAGVNTVALSANALALGNATAYPAMVSLETLVSASNADANSMGFLIRPGHRGALRTAQRFASTDSPVYQGGKILDYRAEVTNQLAVNLTTGTATTICSAIAFGDFSQLLIANFGATDVVADSYTLAVNGVVRIIARKHVAIGVRHPESFAILGGVLTT